MTDHRQQKETFNNNFAKLKVWGKAHKLTLSVYKVTQTFPTAERFGLTTQLRRAISSVPANIVEGNSRLSKKEFGQFLSIARGSLEESKYHLLLAKDLKYLTKDEYQTLQEQIDEVGKMLNGLVKSLKTG